MRVVILGAGPAGMTCANALLSFGIAATLLERSGHLGGAQRTNFHPNLWLLGAPEESGRALTERMVRHFRSLPIEQHVGARLERVDAAPAGFTVSWADTSGQHRQDAGALVVATGTRPYAPDDLRELAARSRRVLIGPLADAIRDDIRGQRVLILGGGDNALDHALYLAERGNSITVRTRRDFTARPHFLADCRAQPAIRLMVQRPAATPFLDGDRPRLADDATAYDWLLVMYGYRPNTELLDTFAPDLRPTLTPTGHIRVDTWQRSDIPGILAAGDITETPQPSVLGAMAQGLAAAKAIERVAENGRAIL
jgi:thioredoxin reductase